MGTIDQGITSRQYEYVKELFTGYRVRSENLQDCLGVQGHAGAV